MFTWCVNVNLTRYSMLVVTLCALSGQAYAQTGGFGIEQQLDQLRKMVLNHEQELSSQKQQIQSLQGKNAVLKRQLTQFKQQLTQLKQKYQRLQAQVNRRRTDTPVPDELSAPDTMPVRIEETPNPHLIPPSAATTLPPNTQPVKLTAKTEKGLYQQAYKLVETQQFGAAIDAMRQVIERYPQGQYADNAQYWLGEAQYALRRYQPALAAFNTLMTDYSTSSKRPHALLKIGYCYYELQDYAAARAVLKQVQVLYPATSTARLAAQRLQRMQAEGV